MESPFGDDAPASPLPPKSPLAFTPPPKAKELANRVLHFVSTANNETLGACAIGLGAVTYMVLGRVGLVIIGAVGGVVLHATWEEQNNASAGDPLLESKRRKETGLDIVKRVLEAQRVQKAEASDEDGKTEVEVLLSGNKELNFEGFRPATKEALDELVDAAIRDYVKYWYSPILPQDETFPAASRRTLTGFILSFSSHLSRKRPADVFLTFLTNSTSIFVVFLNELAAALSATGMNDANTAEVVLNYLDKNPDSNLATVLDRGQQTKKLKTISDDILESFLDFKAFNCEPVHVFLQQILANTILDATLENCSRPEWINDWIVYLLEEGEPELLNVIDEGVGQATGKGPSSAKRESFSLDNLNSEARDPVKHKRNLSKAEEAMEEAMQEAKRLTEMIQQEEAEKERQRAQQEDRTSIERPLPPPPSDDLDEAGKSSNEVWREEQPSSVPSIPNGKPSTDVALHSKPKEAIGSIHEPSEPVVPEPAHDKSPELPPEPETARPFTSFDQILPPQQPSPELQPEPAPFTLHKARVTIFDDGMPGERAKIRSKPVIEYLLQIEPASSSYSGWMSARKYADFETLHEIIRRIATISGTVGFVENHASVPPWKSQTKEALRSNLEVYLNDALAFETLAESDAMKRFLEKEKALGKSTPNKGVLGFPTPEAFQTMGKGMLDVLSSAPKGAADGSKALFTGVAGVFGQKNKSSSQSSQGLKRSDSTLSQSKGTDRSSRPESRSSSQVRPSTDALSNISRPSVESSAPPLPERPRPESSDGRDPLKLLAEPPSDVFGSQSSSVVNVAEQEPQAASAVKEEARKSAEDDLMVKLPPPPSAMPDDFIGGKNIMETPIKTMATSAFDDTASEPSKANQSDADWEEARNARIFSAMNEDETKMAVELLFALITELYTLSSAWTLRKTLLSTAKLFLLRPGNPSLEAIRNLIQSSVIEAHSSDEGLAAHIRTTRANALPTEEEFTAWPKELTAEEKEALRVKARRLFVQQGMPAALVGVMGQAATQEAMGRVFDALQVKEVARGLFFALMLQAVRAMAH